MPDPSNASAPHPQPVKARNPSKAMMVAGLRVLGSALALVLVFHFVSFDEVWKLGQRLPAHEWVIAFGLFLCGHALAAAKWGLLIDARLPFGRLLRAHLAGLGANLALPGVAGGDLVRAGLLMSVVPDKGRLAAGSLIDRLIDTLGLGLIMLAGAWALWADALSPSSVVWRLLALAVPATLLFVAAAALARRIPTIATAGRSKPVRLFARLLEASALLAGEPARLAACLGISLFVQGLFVAINVALADAVGVAIAAAGWAYAWAGAKILAILPISLGGLGVREASMAALLKPFGAAPQQVVAVGLLWQTILYASGVLGLVVQSLAALPARRSPQEAVR